MPTRTDGFLTLGEIVTYAGPETDWQPKVTIHQTAPVQGLERMDAGAFRCRVFDTVQEAVYWARDHHYDGVTISGLELL